MENSDAIKGKCTRNQLIIWDRLLEIRIQLQKILADANLLPHKDISEIILSSADLEDEEKSEMLNRLKESKNGIQSLLMSLLGLQESLTNQNPEVTKLGKEKRKNAVDGEASDEEIPSDEEIDSDEAEESATADGVDALSDGSVVDEDNVDDDVLESEEEEEAVAPKRRKIQDAESEVKSRFDNFAKYRNETIQKWNDKTQLGTGKRNFSAFQTPTLHQIEQVLKDRTRLVKRTQLKRSQYSVIGSPLETTDTDELQEGNDHDAEIFDDDDFYHQLLRELIDRKTANVTDPIELSQRWLQIQKLRNKMKKKVDTKASKGRKLRYEVIPKLVNFMAPYDNSSMPENAVNELFSSLFGQRKEC